MDQRSNRDRPLRQAFGITPNALWTLPHLTPNQRCLLGWLHSHADNYLARLTLNRIGNEYGCGTRAGQMVRALRDAGWCTITDPKPGHPARVVLLSDPWEDLLHHSQNVNTTIHETGTPPFTEREHHHSQDVNTEKNTVEAQPEHQKETAPLTLIAMPDQPPPGFDSFWEQYPRKAGKDTARSKWAAMSHAERWSAFDALERWSDYYATIEPQFVPHCSTWINQRRWEDMPPRPVAPPRSSPTGWGAIERRRTATRQASVIEISSGA